MADAECTRMAGNLVGCPCADSGCERAGNCCECVRHHLSGNGLVSCQKAKLSEDADFRANVAALVSA